MVYGISGTVQDYLDQQQLAPWQAPDFPAGSASFLRTTKPINPSTTNAAPATINQCANCIAGSWCFISPSDDLDLALQGRHFAAPALSSVEFRRRIADSDRSPRIASCFRAFQRNARHHDHAVGARHQADVPLADATVHLSEALDRCRLHEASSKIVEQQSGQAVCSRLVSSNGTFAVSKSWCRGHGILRGAGQVPTRGHAA
jgi:hypothetical protein